MDKNKSVTTTPEFSRIIQINSSILDKRFQIIANEEECDRLSYRFNLECIKNLEAECIITKREDLENSYTLICHMKSDIVKFKIEDDEEKFIIEEEFSVVLLDPSYESRNLDFLDNEDIEFLSQNDSVDIGEIVSQYVSLFVFM